METMNPKEDHHARRWVALAGNPNSGKTTLFNRLTGRRMKVANYPGVTIEKVTGECSLAPGYEIGVIDIPGTYSLSARSQDEIIARDVLIGLNVDAPQPDLVLCILDASQLDRHLLLVSQVMELGRPMILVLNMIDRARDGGSSVETLRLEAKTGLRAVAVSSLTGEGFDRLKEAIREALERPELHLPRPDRMAGGGTDAVSAEQRAIWIRDVLGTRPKETAGVPEWQDRLDHHLTGGVTGWLVFIAIISLMFFTIFSVAQGPADLIDSSVAALASTLRASLPPGPLSDLLTQGALPGAGAVLIFLPQIIALFFFIALLESTGYMARAALLADRLMRLVGLQGRSFIPLLSGFACSVPGIMAGRTLSDRRERLLTILITPFMPCGARLPVYALMIAAFFPSHVTALEKTAMLFALYAFGLAAAFFTAWLFRRTLLAGGVSNFLLELPPYQAPPWGIVARQMVESTRLFLQKAGTLILGFSVLLWALMSWPRADHLPPDRALEQSYAGRLGKLIEPAIEPLGYDWRIGVGLVGSFAAREIFVSTLGVVFQAGEDDADVAPLREAMRAAVRPDGSPLFTPLTCLSILAVYVLSMQCVSTIAVLKMETGGWGWPLLQFSYMSALAYGAAFAVYQGGLLLGWS